MLNAIAALRSLHVKYDAASFSSQPLFGRMTRYAPNIYIDVGHNALAAEAVRDFFKKEKIVLVYNTFADKEYATILQILKPICKRVEIIPIVNERSESREKLERTLRSLAIAFSSFEACREDETYLVFGSFSVVEAFLHR